MVIKIRFLCYQKVNPCSILQLSPHVDSLPLLPCKIPSLISSEQIMCTDFEARLLKTLFSRVCPITPNTLTAYAHFLYRYGLKELRRTTDQTIEYLCIAE
jgi:hypothetical protein